MAYAIEIEQLTRRFGERTAVNSLTFKVEEGEVFGLLGPNGAGKTTLVRLLNGVLGISGGAARVLGWDAQTQGDDIRKHTGVLTESPSLYERLTARDNLRFFGTLYGVPDSELNQRVSESLEQFGLADRADERAGSFSKGMKQRLALARTLVHRPQVLFFDEPTAALDPEAAQQVTDLIAQLSGKDGRTVFLCTHNLDEAERLCDRVGIINQGHLLAVGKPEQLAGNLWQGLWVDFTLYAPPETELIERIRKLSGVSDASLDGLQMAVQVADQQAIPSVIAGVVTAGAQVIRVNPREHSLHDIYFKLQEEAKR